VGVAKQLFCAKGAACDDKDGRQDGVMRRFRPFDAPVCVIVTHDRDPHGMDDAPFDGGAVVNSQGVMRSPVVRAFAGVADDPVIMKSIALAWPDETFPANAVVSERKSVAEATDSVGFDA
jgi:hypothetical protein